MFRCRIPIAILLVLTLPLQSFARRTCCQTGQKSCCSISADKSDAQLKSCCTQTEAQPTGCKHCAAAKAKSIQPSLERCTCHCKQNPQERPATEFRRELRVESIFASQDSIFEFAELAVSARVKIEVTNQSPRLRLHAIHCVWLN